MNDTLYLKKKKIHPVALFIGRSRERLWLNKLFVFFKGIGKIYRVCAPWKVCAPKEILDPLLLSVLTL